jgi:hypothetical protein
MWTKAEFDYAKERALVHLKSGLVPNDLNSVEKVLHVMQVADELDVPETAGFREINIIHGSAEVSPKLQLALIYKNHPGAKIQFIKRDSQICHLKAKRSDGEFEEIQFTIKDAEIAGLMRNSQWKKYPRQMLHARCVAEMCRSVFPDATIGAGYTESEVAEAVAEAEETEEDATPETIPEKTEEQASNDERIQGIRLIVTAFKAFGVETAAISKRYEGKALAQLTDEEIEELRNIYVAIRDETEKPEVFFDMSFGL